MHIRVVHRSTHRGPPIPSRLGIGRSVTTNTISSCTGGRGYHRLLGTCRPVKAYSWDMYQGPWVPSRFGHSPLGDSLNQSLGHVLPSGRSQPSRPHGGEALHECARRRCGVSMSLTCCLLYICYICPRVQSRAAFFFFVATEVVGQRSRSDTRMCLELHKFLACL